MVRQSEVGGCYFYQWWCIIYAVYMELRIIFIEYSRYTSLLSIVLF